MQTWEVRPQLLTAATNHRCPNIDPLTEQCRETITVRHSGNCAIKQFAVTSVASYTGFRTLIDPAATVRQSRIARRVTGKRLSGVALTISSAVSCRLFRFSHTWAACAPSALHAFIKLISRHICASVCPGTLATGSSARRTHRWAFVSPFQTSGWA
jgi:hypothetical protein